MHVKVVYPAGHLGGEKRETFVRVEATEEMAALDEAFRKMNVVDGTEIPAREKFRSMSVGDIARAGDKWFICDPVGWREIPEAFALVYSNVPGEDPLSRAFGLDHYLDKNPSMRRIFEARPNKAMTSVDATYVSIWDGGTEIRSACKYDPFNNVVYEIESVDVGGLEVLEEEFIELKDGSRISREFFSIMGEEDEH